MRLWLSESERRPDPAPVRADARKAVLVGTIGWILALIGSLVFRARLAEMNQEWLVWASATGVALGVVGLLVVQVVRRRSARQDAGSPD